MNFPLCFPGVLSTTGAPVYVCSVSVRTTPCSTVHDMHATLAKRRTYCRCCRCCLCKSSQAGRLVWMTTLPDVHVMLCTLFDDSQVLHTGMHKVKACTQVECDLVELAEEQVGELRSELEVQAHSHQLAQEALAIEEKCSRDKMQAQVRQGHHAHAPCLHAWFGDQLISADQGLVGGLCILVKCKWCADVPAPVFVCVHMCGSCCCTAVGDAMSIFWGFWHTMCGDASCHCWACQGLVP